MRNVHHILSKFQIRRGPIKPINLVRFKSGYLSDDLDYADSQSHKFEKCLNEVRLLGRVGSDPVVSERNGKQCVEFVLGTSKYTFENEMIQGPPDWHSVFSFNPTTIKSVESFVRKGHRLYISGKLAYIKEPNTRNTYMGVLLYRFISFS